MKRILRRLLLALLLLSAISVVLVYRLVATSLPQLDGEISVDGISESASIARDGQGIATISAANRFDLAYATGFAHGQDRFFQMDLTRRQAAGELAELFGAVAVRVDRTNRLHRFRARAKTVLQRVSDREHAILAAYSNGVNAGLASLGAAPFEYRVLSVEPQPWQMQDSILVAYAMFMVLNDERAAADVQRGLANSILPQQVYAWMYPAGTRWDAPLQGEISAAQALPAATVFDISGMHAALEGTREGRYAERQLPGSNNWAVSGAHTRDGRAIVANDMHLDITVPNVFYRARLIVQGSSDTAGLTLPGTPVIVTGSNGRVAWAFTNSYGDWSDAVTIRPGADENSYLTAGGVRQFEVVEETIEVKGAAAEILIVRETIWGPVLDDTASPEGEIAVSWIAHDPLAINLRQIELENATGVEEAMAIANNMGIPPQNFVCGDALGNIGWTIAGRVPRRADYDAQLPADWSDGNGWLGWLPAAEYPRILNPESGRIWTANARVVDGAALDLIGDGGYDLGARARQIRDALFAKQTFQTTDMLDIQNDDRAVFLHRWRDLLLEVLDTHAVAANPGRRQFRDLLLDWIPRASTDSVGYRLVRDYRTELRSTVFDMLMTPVRRHYGAETQLRISNQFEAPLWQLLQQQPRHLLSADYANWQQLMLSVLDRQLKTYADNYDDALSNRSWGERNTAAVRHPISRALPFLSGWLDMPAEPLSGDTNMPKALGPAFGASERFAVAPGDERNSYLHMPAGQSGHPMSEFYRAGHDDWVNVRATPFLPGVAEYILTLSPAG